MKWKAVGYDGSRVEICSDRACSTSIAMLETTQTSAKPGSDLPTGIVYWRVRGRIGVNYDSNTSPTWQYTVGKLSPSVDTSWGTVLDVNGDGYGDIAVGAPHANSDVGRVHVFHGSKTGLSSTPAKSLSGPDGGQFGNVVASAGDVNGDGYADLIVGAPNVGTDVGRIYLYLGGASGVAATPVSTRAGPAGAGGLFGTTVASAGDVNGDGYADVAVGATGTDSFTGTVYVYLGGPGGLDTSYLYSFAGPDGAGGYFGYAVASAGDLNGDGFEDLAVGSPWPLDSVKGHAYVYMGSANGFTAQPKKLTDPASSIFGFGASLTGGDFNGDGYSDLIVGQPRMALVNLYPGSSNGISTDPTIKPTAGANDFGTSVAAVGDVDGDGYTDLAIGDPSAPDSGSGDAIGAMYVYFGGSSSPLSTKVMRQPVFPDAVFGSFGYSVAAAGDVEADGNSDVVVGAPLQDPSTTGNIYLFHGKSGSLQTTWNPDLAGPDGNGGSFGFSVAALEESSAPFARGAPPRLRGSRIPSLVLRAARHPAGRPRLDRRVGDSLRSASIPISGRRRLHAAK
jgi:hypothetical protein